MYKTQTKAGGHHDLSIGFDGDLDERAEKSITGKNNHGQRHLTNLLIYWVVFLFPNHQQKTAKKSLKKDSNHTELSRHAGTVNGKIDIKNKNWFVSHFTQSTIESDLLNEQNLTKYPTEIADIERSVTSKIVQQQDAWKIDLGVGQGTHLSFYVEVGVHQWDRIGNQALKIDRFYTAPVTFAQRNIEIEKNPDSALNLDSRNGRFCQIVSCSRKLTNYHIPQP